MKRYLRFIPLLAVIALVLFWPSIERNLRAQAVGAHSVALTWNAGATDATHTGVATGYNVKRGTTAGGPYTTIASPATTAYTDASVAGGAKYFYVITGTCPTCAESAPSNEVGVTIPLDQLNPPTGLAPGVVK